VRRRVKLAGLRHTLTEEQVAAMARVAHGFVGADIAALCSEAAMTALRRCVAADGAGITLVGDVRVLATAARRFGVRAWHSGLSRHRGRSRA